jgi:hypothetical protein
MIDIFTNGSFTLFSFRTMDFNLTSKPDENNIINDLTLRINRDNLSENKIDRIYASWVVFSNNKKNIYKITEYANNTIYAKPFYISNKDFENDIDVIKIIKRYDEKTDLPYYNPPYSYKFFTIKIKN